MFSRPSTSEIVSNLRDNVIFSSEKYEKKKRLKVEVIRHYATFKIRWSKYALKYPSSPEHKAHT